MKIQHTAYARVGLLGNPSDGYFGKTLAFSVSNFAATVTLEPSESLVILPHPLHDPSKFASLQQLVSISYLPATVIVILLPPAVGSFELEEFD
jgi:hypothetical protein